MDEKILIVDDFLSNDECDKIYQSYENKDSYVTQKDSFWYNRVKRHDNEDNIMTKLDNERRICSEKFFIYEPQYKEYDVNIIKGLRQYI